MRNPESGEAKELLEEATKDDGEGTAGALPGVLPWWEASDVPDERDEGRYAEPPGIIEDEAMRGIKPPPGTGTKLAYNAIAISYVTRREGLRDVLTGNRWTGWPIFTHSCPSASLHCLLPTSSTNTSRQTKSSLTSLTLSHSSSSRDRR